MIIANLDKSSLMNSQQLWLPTTHVRSDDDPNSLIDDSVKENRLYQRIDGSIGIAEKSLGYVIGEQVVRPLIDTVYYLGANAINSTPTQMVVNRTRRCFTAALSYVQYFAKRIDGALSFPAAEAVPLRSTKYNYVKEVKGHIKETYDHYSEVIDTINRVTNEETYEEVEPSKLEKTGEFFEKLKAAWRVIEAPMNWYEELFQGELEESDIKQLNNLKEIHKKIYPLENHFKLLRQKNQCQEQMKSISQRMNDLLDMEANIKAQVEKEAANFFASQSQYADALRKQNAHVKRGEEIRLICERNKIVAERYLLDGNSEVASAASENVRVCEQEFDQINEAAKQDKISADAHYDNAEKADININNFTAQFDLLDSEYRNLKERLEGLREKWRQIYSELQRSRKLWISNPLKYNF